jgi:anti-sigma B factor antagonist
MGVGRIQGRASGDAETPRKAFGDAGTVAVVMTAQEKEVPMSLVIQTETADAKRGARITLEGRLDTMTAPELEQRLESLLDGRYDPLIFDLARLDFISSAGIRVLVRAHKTMRNQRGGVQMVNPQPQIAKVFDIVRTLPGVAVFKDEAELDEYLATIQRRVQEDRRNPASRGERHPLWVSPQLKPGEEL